MTSPPSKVKFVPRTLSPSATSSLPRFPHSQIIAKRFAEINPKSRVQNESQSNLFRSHPLKLFRISPNTTIRTIQQLVEEL